MSQVGRSRAFALLLAVGSLGSGCTRENRFGGEIRLLSSSQITVVRASAHRKLDGILVEGDVQRTKGRAGKVEGYLHLEGRQSDGSVVSSCNVHWGEFLNRRLRQAYFKAFLSGRDPSAIVLITVEPVG